MEFLRSRWFGKRENSQASSELFTPENTPDSPAIHESLLSQDSIGQETTQQYDITKHWDPKVVEFFNDFPEPYRQKAIERFSKREGLHRFEIFRDLSMSNEMRSARRGIFLEDQREYEEWSEERDREQRRLELEKEKELFYTREIPAWEQQALKVIPLQPGDKMWLKLAISANASAFGIAFLAKWWDFQRSTPKPKRPVMVRTLLGSAGVCCFMQLFAVYRLMDLGPFDKSTDERNFLVKVAEDSKKDLTLIQQYLEEKISNSKR